MAVFFYHLLTFLSPGAKIVSQENPCFYILRYDMVGIFCLANIKQYEDTTNY